MSSNQVWKNLTTLHSPKNRIGDEGATALSGNQVWKNLTTFHLPKNQIGHEGATAVTKYGRISQHSIYQRIKSVTRER